MDETESKLKTVDNTLSQITTEISDFLASPNAFRSVLILIFAMFVAYWLSSFVARLVIITAKRTAIRSDAATDAEKRLQLRRLETYLTVSTALVRALIVGTVAFYMWQYLSESASLSTAAIGASAFFIVLGAGTLGLVLRDITAGSTMIIERWFNVGDFIRVEPFLDVHGVVERMTLRSTKLRSLNGEVVWMHNQYMQAVKVTPHGLRTIAVDVFVNNPRVGKSIIEKAIATIPISTMTVTEAPEIERSEQWGDYIWLYTIIGKTPPGREWIMENYFVESLKELDEKRRGKQTFVRPPLVRYADPAAERSFKRAVKK